MILFWVICAVFVVIALAFVLPTLMQAEVDTHTRDRREANLAVYRDQLDELGADLRNGIVSQEQYQQDRDEIDKRLLEDVAQADEPRKSHERAKLRPVGRGSVYAVAFGIPLLGVLLYLKIGDRNALRPGASPPTSAATQSGADAGMPDQRRIEANVAALAKRMEQEPGNADGWAMLATSYVTLGKFAEAANAYEKASALKPNDAGLMAQHAFALAMSNQRRLAGRPSELIQQALKIDPENPRVLQLAGVAAFEAQNYQQAIAHWEKVLTKVGTDADLRQAITERIAEARQRAGTKQDTGQQPR